MATGKSTSACNAILALLLNATNWANIADNTVTGPLLNLFLALSTGTLSNASAQNTTEAAYTSYNRVAVARTTAGFSAPSGSSSSLVATASFPAATGGSETETYASLGSNASGAGNVYYWGIITPSLVVSLGVTPQLTTASTVAES